MRMNRRNVLVGLGTIVAGGGAALGTGAFSSVEAERDVKISVADDSNALLGLVAGNSEFVSSPTDGVLTIDLSNVNLDARTTINGAFTIHNNTDAAGADQEIVVSANITDYGDISGSDAQSEVDEIVQFNEGDNGNNLLEGDSITLSDSTESKEINLVIDTTVDTSHLTLENGTSIVDTVEFSV